MGGKMLGVDEALALIRAEAAPLGAECVSLAEANGRLLAEPIVSTVDLPPFDNTAMDGFALRCGGEALPAGSEFEVTGLSAAGDAVAHAREGAWRIMTGAPIPAGCDSVIPVEQVTVLAQDAEGALERIRLEVELPPGQHIRRAGEDVRRGARLVDAGSRVNPEALALLAALGIGEVALQRRPRVAVLCTGRELVDDPAAPLANGQIRNSNGPFLAAALPAHGAELVLRETVPDTVEAFLASLQRAVQAGSDVVLSTGAVSMGEFDFVPEALARIGAETIFHKVRMRPGKPLLFARLASGALFFGLPGNPVSAAVGLRFFVSAALRALQGLPPESPLRLPLRAHWTKKPGLRLFAKARVVIDAGGQAMVEVLQGQESFRLAPLLRANAWAVLPEDAASLDAGEVVEVFALGPEGWRL
jgi:molybdopterin molybdotransferase